jgi:hypothetical protein
MLPPVTTILLQSSIMANVYFRVVLITLHAITTLPPAVMMEHAHTPVVQILPPSTSTKLQAAKMALASMKVAHYPTRVTITRWPISTMALAHSPDAPTILHVISSLLQAAIMAPVCLPQHPAMTGTQIQSTIN